MTVPVGKRSPVKVPRYQVAGRAGLLELHIYGHVQLKLGLTGAFAQYRELRLDEKIEYDLFCRNDPTKPKAERHMVGVVFKVEYPDRRAADVVTFGIATSYQT